MINNSWTIHEQGINKLLTTQEQVMDKYHDFLCLKLSTNYEKVKNIFWTSCEQVINNSRTSHKQSVNKLWISNEQVMNKLWTTHGQVTKKCEQVVIK